MYRRILEELYLPQWVIPGVLAQAQRPGYPVDRPSLEKVQEWADVVRDLGIKSILCILDYPQLAHYDRVGLDGGGLLPYYRRLGLNVAYIAADDHKVPPLSVEELEAVWAAFEKLPKPVLVHCSAGRDRTGAAVVYILAHLHADEV